jgi:hypothetical protein
MAYGSNKAGLAGAFGEWNKALNSGNLKKFYDFFDARSEILDEDYPWRMNKAEFMDHIGFHAGASGKPALWEHFQWIARDVEVKVWHKHTGHVSGFSTFRGKPVDAGFRQRFMGFTTSWHHHEGAWKLICWHQSPLIGRIDGASPS